MNDIPLIDVSAARLDGEPGKQAVAREIDRACRAIGFFTLHGHGIPRQVFEDAHGASREFFRLPLAEKMACKSGNGFTLPKDPYTPYGYSALLEENAYAYMGLKGQPSDYVEKISAGRLILDDGEPLPFPQGAQGQDLRRKLKRYYQACQQLAAMLAELMTIPLGLSRDHFQARMDRANDSMRSQLYPAASGAFANDQGMGAHTDGTLLTILTQTAPGIQVRNKDGHWIVPAMHDIDHFIVNIGDLLAHWSGRRYVSTEHRVVLTRQERQSIVFFKLTNEDTLVEFGNAQMDALFGRTSAGAA
jgi:isopenicillin N synthase-like dioxygenase